MMIGKLRYFFWSSIFSGAVLIYSVVSGGFKTTIQTLSAVHTQGAAGLPEKWRARFPLVFHEYLPNAVKRKIPCHVWDNIDRLSEVNYYPDSAASSCRENGALASAHPEEPTSDNDQTADADADGTKRAPASVNATKPPKAPFIQALSANRTDIENGKYVEIDGKYYKKRDDNIYNIGPMRIYFENNRRYVLNEKDLKTMNRITTTRSAGAVGDQYTGNQATVDQAVGDSAAPRHVDSEETSDTPSSPAEMMQVLQKAQESEKAEQETLKKLDLEK